MSSTPQSPRTASPLLSSRASDTAVAPYLTHIVTHHGKITLLPPQNQGRVRTNKKLRRKAPQPDPHRDVQPLTSRPATSLGATTPSGRKQKSRRNIIQTSTNAEGQGSSRTGSGLEMTPSVLLPPPPSYESIRPDTLRTPGNDVIALSSSSSDDFEDITEMDLESRWELDRMSGFTLEERVRREWFRRQAVMERTTQAGAAASTPSPEPPPPPPKDHIIHETEVFSPTSTHSEHVHPVEAFQRKPRHRSPPVCHTRSPSSEKANSSRSTLEDWDLLESHLSGSCSEPPPLVQSSSSGNPNVARHPPDHSVRTSYHGTSSADVSSGVTKLAASEVSRSTEPLLSGVTRMLSPHPLLQPEGMISTHGDVDIPSNATLSAQTSGEPTLVPRPTLKGKEREANGPVITRSDDFHGSTHSAIHHHQIPAPPIPQVSHEPTVSITEPATPTHQISGQAPPFSLGDKHPPELPALSMPRHSPSDSVRDRIVKFESMRDRPVPPPPADFLARSRVKRKPPPVPPSSYRHRMFELETRAPNVRVHPIDDRLPSEPHQWMPSPTHSENLPSSPDIHHALTTQRLSEIESRTSLVRPSTPARTESHGNDLPPCDAGLPSEPAAEDALAGNGGPRTPGLRSDNDRTPIESASEGPIAVYPALPPSPDVLRPAADTSNSTVNESLPVEAVPSGPPSTRPLDAGTTLGPYTDLDVLLSRLDDAASGNRYDDLLIVSDLLGPAQPQQASPSQILADLPLGRVEVLRRRKLQNGRVKLKLSLLGVVVDRCGACLSQFKDAELAVLLPCLHPFHSTCLQSWLARSSTCPLCRVTLDVGV